MARIAVFDSGLGSLSIIKPVQKKIKSEIIYFADQENYPYGTKPPGKLQEIINSTIEKLEERFRPDVIVVASNTPSLLLKTEKKGKILGVYPPLKEASILTESETIAILATRSVIKSRKLQNYIKRHVPDRIKVIKVDASPLVDLVESGKFISDMEFCKKIIRKKLLPMQKSGADVATLSSTHLPFLLPMLEEQFPDIKFLDPADLVAERIAVLFKNKRSKTRRLRIFASGDTDVMQKKLEKIGIRNKVIQL